MESSILEVAVPVAVALGLREILAFLLTWYRERYKDKASQEQLRLGITDSGLDVQGKALKATEELASKVQAQMDVITKLHEQANKDKTRLDRKDGIIEYQQKENERLFEIVTNMKIVETKLQAEVTDLSRRVDDLERANRELIGLRDENTMLVSQALQMKAILKELRLRGVWEGDENAIHGTL